MLGSQSQGLTFPGLLKASNVAYTLWKVEYLLCSLRFNSGPDCLGQRIEAVPTVDIPCLSRNGVAIEARIQKGSANNYL
jgi:hypothetical protein